MRLDKLLWFLRFTKTRPLAQAMAEAGHMRLNGRRVERSAQPIQVGDVLVLPLPAGIRVVEILALPDRRGPAVEAQGCYRELDVAPANPIAATRTATATPPRQPHRPGKPGDLPS